MESYRICRTAKNLRPRIQTASPKDCGIAPSRSDRGPSARIIAPMTPAQTRPYGVVTPSLPQLLLTAMLRVLVELVLNVASTLRMRPSRLPAECHTDVPPAALPEETNDTCKEPTAAKQRSHTASSPSVSLASQAIHLPLLRRWRQTRLRGIASTAEGGGGGLRALARKTEGASHVRHSECVHLTTYPKP